MSRREYEIAEILVNKASISKVIIDSHYEEKHGDYINDELILDLVKNLDGRIETPQTMEDGYSYFATLLEREDKQYRLVWLLQDNQIYIGVINAYRDDREI